MRMLEDSLPELKHEKAILAGHACVWMMTSQWTFCLVPRLELLVRNNSVLYLSHLSCANFTLDASGKKRRKPGQEASRFKTDEETGKMVIDNENDGEQDGVMGEDVAGAAYRESLTAVDGFTRGPNGRVKFNKDTKKRRREDNDTEDVEMVDVQTSISKREKKRHEPTLGHEFKAKVRGLFLLFEWFFIHFLFGLAESWRRRQKGGCGSIRLSFSFTGSQEEGQTRPYRNRGKEVIYSCHEIEEFVCSLLKALLSRAYCLPSM